MKVLVVEDNLAIGEVLKEVLTGANYSVQIEDKSDSVAEMALDGTYDFVLLDADMEGGNGLKIIDRMCETESETKVRVIVLKGAQKDIPTDNPYVKALIQKPFLSSDITTVLADVNNMEDDQNEIVRPARPVKEKAGLFKKKYAEINARSMEEMGLEFGRSYVLFQDTTRAVYSVTASFGKDKASILMVTTAKSKAMSERFRGCTVSTIPLDIRNKGEFFDVYRLGTMLSQIEDFIKEADRPLVVFDNLNTLIYKNGMNSVLTLIHEIVTADYGKPFSLVVSVNARDFTDKDKYILKSHLEQYALRDVPAEGKK
ncbi:MAG: response regulator [Candidatus Methanomethylophilaceae archaeon]|jgi:CheY-like chemotaxis protein